MRKNKDPLRCVSTKSCATDQLLQITTVFKSSFHSHDANIDLLNAQ